MSSDVTPLELLRDDFEDPDFGSRGWYDYASVPTLVDTTHVAGSTQALEVHFSAGAQTPPWRVARRLFTPSPTIYISYWVRYSDNWVGSGLPYHPHEFQVMSDLDGDYDGLSNSWMEAYVEQNYQNGGIPRLSIQDSKAINTSYGTPPIDLTRVTEDRSVGGCNGLLEANVTVSCFSFPPWYNDKEFNATQVWFKPTPGPGYKGNWNHVEAYFEINSIVDGIGQADGVAQYWFNGTLVIDRHDVLFRTGARPDINFKQFVMAPYIGDGSPVDQTMWIDNLVVATAPPQGSAPPAPVATVTVSPATVSVAAGQTVQLAATLKDSSGAVLAGRALTWTSSDTAVATVSAGGLVTGVAAGSATITATSEGKTGSAAVSVTTAVTKPGTVSNLAVASVTANSITLSFTEVSNGAGQPANYDVRFAVGAISWGAASSVSQGTCATPVAGGAVGAVRTCTVLGLQPRTSYQFQLVAFRGTMNVDAVYGTLSNVVSGTTRHRRRHEVATVTVSPATASVAAGQTVQLAATLQDASGATLTGRTITWTSSDSAVATVSSTGLVTGVAAGSATITATSEGKTGRAAVSVTTAVTKPGIVSNLAVASLTANSITLSFTEVSNGAGQPANYDVRFAVGAISWGAASSVSQGTCATPVAGGAVGAVRTCTVLGLQPSTSYQFQLVAFRGTMNVNAVFGALSNVASGITAASPSPSPAPSPSPTPSPTPPPPGAILFESDWGTALGNSSNAATDGGKWDLHEVGGTVAVNPNEMVVVNTTAPPGYTHSLRIQQQGGTANGWCRLGEFNFTVPSKDYYLRYYYRTDDVSGVVGSHVVQPGIDASVYNDLVYLSQLEYASGWSIRLRLGANQSPARGVMPNWQLANPTALAYGKWYRVEYWVHFTAANRIQVRIRVYDDANVLLFTEADFIADPDWGAWAGATLTSYYNGTNPGGGISDFGVTPSNLVNIEFGNNGQFGSVSTGLYWYFAGVQIRGDTWPGP